MTITELRQSEEYRFCMEIIRSYERGIVFNIRYSEMDELQSELMKIILRDSSEEGLIDCISFDFDRDGKITEEMWRRI